MLLIGSQCSWSKTRALCGTVVKKRVERTVVKIRVERSGEKKRGVVKKRVEW